jgi:UDP-3-O-[3-hydroxymyristoyl] glucosamine N-acyltransferase
MKLSEIIRPNAVLIRDGSFESLGQCTANIGKDMLTFLEDPGYLNQLSANTSIRCVICTPDLVNQLIDAPIGIVAVEQPKLFFFEIHNNLVSKKEIRSEFETIIGDNCNISPSSCISRNNVKIGDNVIVEEHAIIRANVTIGNNCIIRAGSVIGGQGYEFKRDKENGILRVEHVGSTIIEDYVEIKEFCTIHQAVFEWDFSRIGEHSKLDAHTHIGHATKIGKRVMIGSHGNLAGNIQVEDDVYIGPGVTISNRLTIGSKSKISIGSVVTKNVDRNKVVTGNFAIDHHLFIKDLKEKNRTLE